MYISRVNIPMGGAQQVHTSLDERRKFSYANVRKASYRGNKTKLINIDKVIRSSISPSYPMSFVIV